MTNPIEIQAFSSNNQIHIDDDIGRDGITAKQIKEELSKHRGSIEIHINSAGGAVTEGIAIYNMLKAYSGKKTVFIDSLAASNQIHVFGAGLHSPAFIRRAVTTSPVCRHTYLFASTSRSARNYADWNFRALALGSTESR